MAVSLTHTTVAVGTDAGNGEIRKAQWNENHTLTMAADKLLGRATAGTGAVEEIDCTAAGRALLDDASASAQRTTLGVGTGDSPTFAGMTISSGSVTMSGNISASAWTTNGVRYKSVAGTLTDTSSSGTVAAAYTNVYGGNTIAASNSTTFTDYYTTFITQPTAGTNVTFTRRWALGLSGSISVTGQATMPLQTLTDGANIDWNCASGAKAKVTLAGNRTINAVTNAVEGTAYSLWVIQDGTGSRTLSWTTSGAGSFDFGTDGAPVLTTTASRADLLGFEAINIGGTLKLRFVGIKKGFS